MMTWNYRVFKQMFHGESLFSIHETYYEDDKKVMAVTDSPSSPYGDTKKEIKRDLEMMLEAFNKPTLKWDAWEGKK
jgi:hypothetical protein